MGFGQQLWTRSRCPRGLRLVVLWRPGSCTRGIQRQYSTHNSLNMDFGNTNSSLLKGVSSAGRASEHKHDHVGPFQLGLSPSALRQGEKIPKWSELSVRDKGTFCIMSSRTVLANLPGQSSVPRPAQQTLESYSSVPAFLCY